MKKILNDIQLGISLFLQGLGCAALLIIVFMCIYMGCGCNTVKKIFSKKSEEIKTSVATDSDSAGKKEAHVLGSIIDSAKGKSNEVFDWTKDTYIFPKQFDTALTNTPSGKIFKGLAGVTIIHETGHGTKDDSFIINHSQITESNSLDTSHVSTHKDSTGLTKIHEVNKNKKSSRFSWVTVLAIGVILIVVLALIWIVKYKTRL